MPDPLPNAEKRALKARAQHLEPLIRIGHQGVSEAFLRALDQALIDHGLVKVKFAAFKDEKKKLAVDIAERSSSELIARVGNVAVYFRRKPEATANERE